jgi:hypothetical protein
MATPKPWSFSALNGFTQCPHRYYESGEAALWGTYVHKCIEDLITDAKPLPENAKTYEQQVIAAVWGAIQPVDQIVGMRIEAEKKLAINNKFEPVPWVSWEESWNQSWSVSISDVLKIDGAVAEVIDWKLGKIKVTGQLRQNALLVFHNYPQVNTVHTRFEWLQFKKSDKETFTRDQISELWRAFIPDLKQYAQAFKTDTWQKRPSGLCNGWCPVESCTHWRPKK